MARYASKAILRFKTRREIYTDSVAGRLSRFAGAACQKTNLSAMALTVAKDSHPNA